MLAFVAKWLGCLPSGMLLLLLVFAPTELQQQFAMWSAWNKTLTRHFAMHTDMCKQSQDHGGRHVWQTCGVRGGQAVVRLALLSTRKKPSA